jgi:hypothetical protein
MPNALNQLIAQGRPAPNWDFNEERSKALSLQKQQMELGQMPEELNWLRTQRGMAQEKFGQERTKFQQEQEDLPFKREEDALKFMVQWGDQINLDNYAPSRENLIKRGVNPQLLPPREYFDTVVGEETNWEPNPKKSFSIFHDKLFTGLTEKYKRYELSLKDQELGLKARDVATKEDANRIKEAQGGEPKDEFSRMLEKYEASSGPAKEFYLARLKKLSETSGFQIEVDKDGNVKVTQGPMGGAIGQKPTPAVATELQKGIEKSQIDIADLEAVGDNYIKDALTYTGRGKKFVFGMLDKMSDVLGPLSPENKKFLGKTRVFIESVESFFNRYRKEITGAQAVMKELDMIRQSVLNKELSPTEFEYSYNRLMQQIRRSQRIRQNLLQKGFTGDALGKEMDRVWSSNEDLSPEQIDKRGDELAAEFKGKGIPENQIKGKVIDQLKKEGY